MPSETVYEIEPLRWVHRIYDDNKYGDVVATAYIPFGEIEIRNQVTAYYYSSCGRFVSGNHSTFDKAKAAAERWYRQQLRKALRKVNQPSRAKTKNKEGRVRRDS